MKNIILTGFMATGKSSVGRRLAEVLNYKFLDTDKLIEEKTGKSIAQIFKEKGEACFRQLEGDVLEELGGAERVVIATGGGMITGKANYHRLQKLGPIICLQASPEVILERAGKKKDQRPLLKVPDPLEQIIALLGARDYAYARADFNIDTSFKDQEEVVRDILEYLNCL